ncbi:hypothetical protein FDP41_001724 [Naegleria fowleri]|uniref:C2 domain-containing protein n=1 Tax=Naegleria fowleri TaxID=5763 RepID=A0A6A5BXX8_NAEFO|nr:uncharacterized protein FDP41_001724 [Naegleria fowleri]KAF0979381.1 hypothetical protein FDP41_001724 [Naegleria fowleri]
MRLKVTVAKAFELPAMDNNGLSDPFVELWVVNSKLNKYLEPPKNPSDIKKTKIIMKELNPVFNETFEFDFPVNREQFKALKSSTSTSEDAVEEEINSDDEDENEFNSDPMDALLMIRVMDWDKFTKNDFIGFVMIQVFGLNLKPKQKQKRIYPLVGSDQGKIELIFEAIPSPEEEELARQHSQSFYEKPITHLFENTLMTVGPVVGFVKSTSARILVECSTRMPKEDPLQVVCYPIAPRTHLEKRRDYLEKRFFHLHLNDTRSSYHKNILKQLHYSTSRKELEKVPEHEIIKKNVVIPHANIPFGFTIEGLKPDYVYRVEFLNILNRRNRFAIVKTMVDDSIENISERPHHLNVSVVSCNLIERRIPDRDIWERMLERGDEIDVLLHVGDQIYSDCGHNAFDEAVRICDGRTKLTPNEENEIKELYRKYYRLNWNHPPTRKLLAQVSNLMILDDHEIRDDWGSDACDRDKNSVEYYIGTLARQVYWEYQRQLRDEADIYDPTVTTQLSQKHEGYYQIYGDYGILFFDLRAARSFLHEQAGDKVFLTQPQWDDLREWLFNGELAAPKIKALICVCSVPLVFLTKKMTDTLPKITSKLSDMRDHWNYGKNYDEQIGILELIKKWKQSQPNREALFVGGDVHIGGVTEIRHNDELIFKQLTSSSVSNNEFDWATGLSMEFMLKFSSELKDGWSFKHLKWTRKRNYGLIHVATGDNPKPVMNPYINTYLKSYIYYQ